MTSPRRSPSITRRSWPTISATGETARSRRTTDVSSRAEARGAVDEPRQYRIRDQPRHVAAEAHHLLHEAGARVKVRFAGHHEDRLHLRPQVAVHHRHLELVFEVRYRSQAADDDSGAFRCGVIDEQGGEG